MFYCLSLWFLIISTEINLLLGGCWETGGVGQASGVEQGWVPGVLPDFSSSAVSKGSDGTLLSHTGGTWTEPGFALNGLLTIHPSYGAWWRQSGQVPSHRQSTTMANRIRLNLRFNSSRLNLRFNSWGRNVKSGQLQNNIDCDTM